MGSGRKRPIERSPTPTGRDGEEKKKEGKKKKKNKVKIKETTTEPVHKSSLETTATSEGQKMAQILATFSRLEQSRFEAYRRAAFSGDAISKYVAHCLIEHHPDSRGRSPVLSDICAEGQAEEITVVVATLAKAYAQRLVSAAREVSGTNQAIEPRHILQAFGERQVKGLDPGFFLQSAKAKSTIVMNDDSYERRRLAALHAQEEFDKEHGIENEDEDSSSKKDDSMEIETTNDNSKKEMETGAQ